MRRKRSAALIAPSSKVTRDTSSWASLHEDLVSLIGNRVLAGDLRDYIRFRAACHHWRLSTGAACPLGRGVVDPRFHPRRWMMLPEGHGLYPGHGKMRGYIRFFNLSTGDLVRLRLPLFRDHCLLDSMDGILLLHRDKDTAIRLLNPFTGDIEELPPLNTLLPYLCSFIVQRGRWEFLRNIRAASISVSAGGVVRVIMSLLGMQCIAYASSGDQQWNVSRWSVKDSAHPLSFQGKLYLLNRPTFCGQPEIFQIDPSYQHQALDASTMSIMPSPPKLIVKFPANTTSVAYTYYMVECDSEVLVVTLSLDGYRQCLVYRLTDLILGRTVPVTSIGGNALFLGTKGKYCIRRRRNVGGSRGSGVLGYLPSDWYANLDKLLQSVCIYY
ncbi:hypothetical protein PR202_ga21163 [Eleusine coracana subsp. coracana]|uniref:KIB1-4 beta-propeller domain-containing protein n=1 Tax=Eleusine coracana subsp. coracana TaxID=191504 RepID=A0AAV5CZY2_ELECO|nr:hypothetical protein PR202_ga21163 [Eleusine coracana subsp. coracana]